MKIQNARMDGVQDLGQSWEAVEDMKTAETSTVHSFYDLQVP